MIAQWSIRPDILDREMSRDTGVGVLRLRQVGQTGVKPDVFTLGVVHTILERENLANLGQLAQGEPSIAPGRAVVMPGWGVSSTNWEDK